MYRFTAVAALFIGAANYLPGAVLYAPTPISSSARVSDYGSADGAGFRTFDNFTVASGASIEKITWRGFWLDFASPVPTAAPSPDAITWSIAFHADDAGVPGTQLFSESVAAADASSTFLGTSTFTAGSTYNIALYDYSFEFTNPFAAAPGMQYWVSVMSRSDLYSPAFVLRGATGGDDISYQQQLGAGLSVIGQNPVARDRALILEGTVPEPGTILLSAAGLLLASAWRRKLQR